MARYCLFGKPRNAVSGYAGLVESPFLPNALAYRHKEEPETAYSGFSCSFGLAS